MDDEFLRLLSWSWCQKLFYVQSCSHSHESFLGEIFDVMTSNLFLRVCESLGMSIMFVVLLLYGGKWCKLRSKQMDATTNGAFGHRAKHSSYFLLISLHCGRWQLVFFGVDGIAFSEECLECIAYYKLSPFFCCVGDN